MSCAVRYYSRSGNTKVLAEYIARGAGTSAVSVDKANAPLKQTVDVLFVGGALYAYGLDRFLKDYLKDIDPQKVGKAVLFSSTWISRHSLDLMRSALKAKGIKVEEETLYVKGKPGPEQLEAALAFGKKFSK